MLTDEMYLISPHILVLYTSADCIQKILRVVDLYQSGTRIRNLSQCNVFHCDADDQVMAFQNIWL